MDNWTLLFQTTMAWERILFLVWISYSQSLKIDRRSQGLEVVPRNLDTSVSDLMLNNNRFITLNYNSFDIYVHLTFINLRRCEIVYIEDGTFSNQDQLRTIFLDYNEIVQLPQSFGPSTPTIKFVSIYEGYKSRSLFRNPYFSEFTRLWRVEMGGKNLEPFDASILPFNIERCRLDLSQLVTFPDFRNQSKLTILTVIGNSISIIPQKYISTLSVLRSFRAERNNIKAIPNLSHMKLLLILELNDNDIISFPRANISGLVSLQRFEAANNLVNIMPNISYLTKLETVDFSNNLIRHVPASCLYDLSMIQSLYLNGNRLILMDDNSMVTGSLYLHDNQLASPPDLYDMVIASLTLRGNPLVCDRLVCWLRMWPFNKTLPSFDNFYCASPSALNGLLAMDTHPMEMGCYNGKLQECDAVIFVLDKWLIYVYSDADQRKHQSSASLAFVRGILLIHITCVTKVCYCHHITPLICLKHNLSS